MQMQPVAAALAGWLLLADPLWLCVSRLHLNDMVRVGRVQAAE